MLISEIIASLNEVDIVPDVNRIILARKALLDFITSSTELFISNTNIAGIAIYQDDKFEELFWMSGGGFSLTKYGLQKDDVVSSLDISPFKMDDKFVYFKLEFQDCNLEIVASKNNKLYVRDRSEMFTDNKIAKLSVLSKDSFLNLEL